MDENDRELLSIYERAVAFYREGKSSSVGKSAVANCSWIAEEIYGLFKTNNKLHLIPEELRLESLKRYPR